MERSVVGIGRGEGKRQDQNFLLEFALFTQVVLPISGGPDPRTTPASYAATHLSSIAVPVYHFAIILKITFVKFMIVDSDRPVQSSVLLGCVV